MKRSDPIATRLEEDTFEEFQDWCDEKGVSKSTGLQLGVAELLDENEEENQRESRANQLGTITTLLTAINTTILVLFGLGGI